VKIKCVNRRRNVQCANKIYQLEMIKEFLSNDDDKCYAIGTFFFENGEAIFKI